MRVCVCVCFNLRKPKKSRSPELKNTKTDTNTRLSCVCHPSMMSPGGRLARFLNFPFVLHHPKPLPTPGLFIGWQREQWACDPAQVALLSFPLIREGIGSIFGCRTARMKTVRCPLWLLRLIYFPWRRGIHFYKLAFSANGLKSQTTQREAHCSLTKLKQGSNLPVLGNLWSREKKKKMGKRIFFLSVICYIFTLQPSVCHAGCWGLRGTYQ